MKLLQLALLFTASWVAQPAFGGTDDHGLPASAAMGEWITAHQLRIHESSTANSFLAVNAGNGYQAVIDASGFTLSSSDADGWDTRMDVIGHGRESSGVVPWHGAHAALNEADLRFQGSHMQVQYVHGTEGLRQNFLIAQRPQGTDALRIELRYCTDLWARSAPGGGFVFVDHAGVEHMSYTGLKVWDDCGRILPAHFTEDPTCQGSFTIEVDDTDATYPLTIDPVASSLNVSLTGPIAGSEFGRAVGSAGDLNGDGYSDVVVGASEGAAGEAHEGLAYVYYGSNTGIANVPNVILQSDQVNAFFGYSVSTAGDVNGDGYSDLLIGAQNWESDISTQDREGAVFVYHGSATGISTTPAIILQSDVTLTYFGFSVACAGDINNDGYSDIVVGAPYANFPSSLEGAAYVFLGSAAGLSNTYHKRLERNQGGAQVGVSVAGAGDVNGDGYSDIAVGAFSWDFTPGGDEGIVCVYHGGAAGLAAGANPAPNTILNATGNGTYLGWSVSTAGDVNGDGYSDLVSGDFRGQLNGGPSQEGTALVFHGSASGLSTVPAAVMESNQLNQLYGRSVSTAGDVNGDGYADIIIGAVTATYGQGLEGAAYVYLGSQTGINTTYLFRYEANVAGANMGESVRTAGDVNGDGYSDMIVGLKLNGAGGTANMYYGGPYSMAATPTLTRYSGSAGALSGASVANAGDMNGDGYSDVLIGAPDASNGQAAEGLVYVHYGSTTGLAAAPSLTLEMNTAGANFGFSVASAGDVNGDGYADVIVGAPNAGGTGRAFIFLGSAGGLATSPALTINGTTASEYGYSVCTAGDVNSDGFADIVIGAPGIATVYTYLGNQFTVTNEGHRVYTGAAGTRFGAAVSTAGDVDGNGYSDIIVGAPNYSNAQTNEGAVYIYHGAYGGLGPTPSFQSESNTANALFGTSVAGVGDVNGNGFYEVCVGAPGWASGQAGEGAAFIYFGTASGITGSGASTVQPNIANAQMGRSVAEAGDVNGDGYADIVIGVPVYTNGQTDEGRMYIVEGAPTGIGAATMVESNVAGARMGMGVAGGGDVNGDGYSDVIGGAPNASPTLTDEGGFFLFGGNQARSLDRRTRQYLVDLVSPLSTNSLDFANMLNFGVGHRSRSHIQRNRVRLRWEVVFEGMPFTGAPITNSLGYTAMSAGWTDVGTAGLELKQLVAKPGAHVRYKWRVREEYPLNKLIDGQRFGRWFYGYASGFGDIGILPIELLSFTGAAQDTHNTLTWVTGSEIDSDRFVVERSANGNEFTPIGEIPALGNSVRAANYDFLDRSPLGATTYYRLRMVDTNGSEELSQVIALSRSVGAITVFPNPASDELYWSQVEGATQAVVMDALGQVVIAQAIASGTVPIADISKLPQGHYTLELRDVQGLPVGHSRFIKAQAPIVR